MPNAQQNTKSDGQDQQESTRMRKAQTTATQRPEEDEEEGENPELDTLIAIAQMDIESALAYETAAELVPVRMGEVLREFAADHRRHVEDLGRFIGSRGEDPVVPAEPGNSVFVCLAAAMGGLGNEEAILSLFGNETFTNQTYLAALETVVDDQAREILERNFADEQRHIAWLAGERERYREIEQSMSRSAS